MAVAGSLELTVASKSELTYLVRDTLIRGRIFRMALAGSLAAFTLAIYNIIGQVPPLPLMILLGVEGFVNQPFHWLLERYKDRLLALLYYQLTIDIMVITAFLHYAGGIEAFLLNTAYFLPIVFGGVLVSTQVSFFAAVFSSVAYGTLVIGEFLGWIPHISTFGMLNMQLSQQILFVCISVFFFNFSGYLAAYPSQVLREHREELAHAKQELEQWNDRLTQRVERKTNELQRTYERLVDSEKLAVLGQFAAGLTHEIDNPLTIIAGRAEALLLRGNLEPKVEQALKTIHAQTKRASEMTAQLLSVSRPIQVHVEPLQLNTLIEETLEGVGYRPEFDHTRVVKELDPGLPTVHGDRQRMIEVLSNLFNNAAQAMLPHGGTLTVRTRAHNGTVSIEVHDDGPGILPEHLSKLFTPFFTTKDVGKGTGLGLFVAQGIVKKHGGSIDINSKPNQGTYFTVTLPVRTHHVASAASSASDIA